VSSAVTTASLAAPPPDEELQMNAKKVGVVGLGNIGSSIGMHLVRNGFEVVGHDVRPEANALLERNGGLAVEGATEVATRSDVIITCLPSEAALQEVLDEVCPHIDGKILVETSTLSLTAKQTAYEQVVAAGGQIVDCPLSGTAMQAREGDVIADVSADEGVAAGVDEVIEGFTRATYQLGSYGTATKMKLIANLWVAVHNVAAAEALVLAQKAGLDLATAVEVIGDGAGASRMLQVRGPMMANGTFDQPGMNVGVFVKDVAIITAMAQELQSPTPMLASSAPIYAAAMAQGWSGSDTASVYAVLAGMANVEPPRRRDEEPR
jgi:L-threonate 2-dehydrogenase